MTTILYAYALAVATWVFYLAAMSLQPHLKTMRPFAKVHGYAVFLVAVLLDALLHFVVGTVLFLDTPARGELLLTKRLKRYHGPAYVGSWRAKLADWICKNLLDIFDPNGKHC